MITAERLRQVLSYDPESGVFAWRQTLSPRAVAGKVAGTIGSNHGYRQIGVDGTTYLAHRLAWMYVYGHFPAAHTDHINGDRTDNRLSNLREATIQQNHWNTPAYKNSKTGIKGVTWRKGRRRWLATIFTGGKKKYIGTFHTIEEAQAARIAATKEYQKDYGRY